MITLVIGKELAPSASIANYHKLMRACSTLEELISIFMWLAVEDFDIESEWVVFSSKRILELLRTEKYDDLPNFLLEELKRVKIQY